MSNQINLNTQYSSVNTQDMLDSEQLRIYYEGVVKSNPHNIDAIQFLGMWHLERHSFEQARKYFGHLGTLKAQDPDVWMCLSICCSMCNEFNEGNTALKFASNFIQNPSSDVRICFCKALQCEKKRDFAAATDGYLRCLQICTTLGTISENNSAGNNNMIPTSLKNDANKKEKSYLQEIRGEVLLRMALLKKAEGLYDQVTPLCENILEECYGPSLCANALCLKGIILEMRTDYPAAEVVYRSALQLVQGHLVALERLGRVYLRYRETIPAAVQCFFKAVETNPSSGMIWYLLGRCYMATAQYNDACEAYNRAINLNPNEPQIWCSLGVLYYAYGQYKEALGMFGRTLRLDPTMADAWYNVGALYDMVDQPEDAQQAYQKAREFGIASSFDRAGSTTNPLDSFVSPYQLSNSMNSPSASVGSAAYSTNTNINSNNNYLNHDYTSIVHTNKLSPDYLSPSPTATNTSYQPPSYPQPSYSQPHLHASATASPSTYATNPPSYSYPSQSSTSSYAHSYAYHSPPAQQPHGNASLHLNTSSFTQRTPGNNHGYGQLNLYHGSGMASSASGGRNAPDVGQMQGRNPNSSTSTSEAYHRQEHPYHSGPMSGR